VWRGARGGAESVVYNLAVRVISLNYYWTAITLSFSFSFFFNSFSSFLPPFRLMKRKERFSVPAEAEKVVDPEMAEKLAKRAKRFESEAVPSV
jgi:hypothetical protein